MYGITSSLYLKRLFFHHHTCSLKFCEKLREPLVAISKKISTVYYGRKYWTDMLYVRVHPNIHKLIEHYVDGGERWPCSLNVRLLLAIARNSLLLFFMWPAKNPSNPRTFCKWNSLNSLNSSAIKFWMIPSFLSLCLENICLRSLGRDDVNGEENDCSLCWLKKE